jgi:hypothetical protein
MERRSARGDSERMLDLARSRELGLELAHLRPHREHAALEDAGDLVQLGLTDARPA